MTLGLAYAEVQTVAPLQVLNDEPICIDIADVDSVGSHRNE